MIAPHTCAWCTRPDPSHGYVCQTCYRPVGTAMREMINLADEPEVNIARQARYGDRDGPRSTERPIPVDLKASSAAWAAAHVVVTWMDHIATVRRVPLPKRKQRPVGPLCASASGAVVGGRCGHASCEAILRHRPEHPVVAAARFVGDHLWWLRHQPDASDAGEELLGAAAAVRQLVENPADQWYAGTCGAPVDGDPDQRCDTELYAWPGVTWVRCPGCRATHQTGPRIRWLLDEARDVHGTATQLATAAARLGRPCTAGQLRALAQRGRLLPATVPLPDGAEGPPEVDRDEWRRPRYLFGAVLDLLDQIAEQRRQDEADRARRAVQRQRRAAEKAEKDTKAEAAATLNAPSHLITR